MYNFHKQNLTSSTLGAALDLHILSHHNDEYDEHQQQHQYAANGDREHGRVLAQLGGAPRSLRARRC